MNNTRNIRIRHQTYYIPCTTHSLKNNLKSKRKLRPNSLKNGKKETRRKPNVRRHAPKSQKNETRKTQENSTKTTGKFSLLREKRRRCGKKGEKNYDVDGQPLKQTSKTNMADLSSYRVQEK